jgi:hypothetical protein
VLTRNGRVETTNYRTVKVPADVEIPAYVKDEFAPFYKAMFERSVAQEGRRGVFTEYFWDMAWCDPCAADPLAPEELRKLGVWWLSEGGASAPGPMGGIIAGGAVPVKLTRLHVRYDWDHFPEDLVFQQTADQANFQGRYVMRHPWKGLANCPAGEQYRRDVRKRQEEEAKTLARLTGWDLAGVRTKMKLGDGPASQEWHQTIFR